jgi:peptidoglycan hydrolase-like protein with peptidoglycan-binding domain
LQAMTDGVRWRPFAVAALIAATLAAMTETASGDRVLTSAAKTAAGSDELMVERGDRGDDVKRIQAALGIPADGIFGPQTERAVKRFQRRNGLLVDGVVGPQTRGALGVEPVTGSQGRGTGSQRIPRILHRIAECESGGNPRAISPGGTYRGKYQFSRGTWRSLGGRGDPAAAAEVVQDRLALKLFRRSGSSPWPNCP